MQLQQQTTRLQNVTISDGELIQQALSGNQNAFEALVQKYSIPLFNFIYHFFADYDQACDILQQVLLQLYISLSTLRTNKPLKSWLFQVARNRCLDELRRKRMIHFSELETGNDEDEFSGIFAILDESPLPEELIEHRDLQQHLYQAIQSLPLKFRAIVLLRYASQLSFPEIGQALDIPEATAKTYFQRAKPLLRAFLSEQSRYST
jgi:RNA polymerase sigma factor (sigma-70 family)